MNLQDLVGTHDFGGIDFSTLPRDQYGDTPNVVRFLLDGITYEVTEDPSDGYRSHMRDIQIVETPVQNRFGPIEVRAEMKQSPDEYGYSNDILQLIDTFTGKPVLSIGTDNTDDYYPSFVSDFQPENMSVNQIEKGG
jgi:hypothetical protein